MTPLQRKIDIVQYYIKVRTNKSIRITFKQNQDNTKEILMLEQAYKYATKWLNINT